MITGDVRRAELRDAPWVDELGRIEGLSVDLEAELARPQACVWVADPSLGFLTAWLVASELQIQDLAVRSAERRRGRARALLHVACFWAEQEGATDATLELRETNLAALALYRSSGFEEVGRRPRYYENGETALLLTKRLGLAGARSGQE